jgi:membrane protein DedA with SNARE-associated domain
MDALTIVLAASHKALWWYYGLMATVGSVLGGYLTYRLGERGGKAMLERRLSQHRADQIYRIFDRYGFAPVAIGAVCPPPMPIVPFLLAPGALLYSRKKFLAALTLGRSVRFSLFAYLGSIYGPSVFRWMKHYSQPLLYLLIGLATAGGLIGFYYWRRQQSRRQRSTVHHPAEKAA